MPLWKRMSADASRGVAVGVGAGAFEAILLGLAASVGVIGAIVIGGQFRDQLVSSVTASATLTPLLWLAPPVERVIAILIMSTIDSVAGYVHLAGLMGTVSVWWIELALAPAAILSIPIIAWCIRNWQDKAS